jgi:outer membrane protein assembly factor BamB
MRNSHLGLGLGVLAFLVVMTVTARDYWEQFRGPTGQGLSDEKGLPVSWNEQKNVKWKTAIRGRGWSSPVVSAARVWLTTATEDGGGLYAVCVDRQTGVVLHEIRLFEVEKPRFAEKLSSYAMPTPVMTPSRVFVTFGASGTACLAALTGEVLWQRRDVECAQPSGSWSSPIRFFDLLIMHFDGSDQQYVIALDTRNGQTAWRTDRSIVFHDAGPDGKPESGGNARQAFSTPILVFLDQKAVLVSLGSQALYGYDPNTGKELWRLENRRCHSGVSRPAYGQGILFVCWGVPNSELWAVRVPKSGQVTEGDVVWKSDRNVPTKSSPVLVKDLLFMVDDTGTVSCLEALTGREVWRKQIGGNHTASPVWADNMVYFFSEDGRTTVIESGREFKVLATNQLDDGFMASPAIASKAFYLRTKTHLYRIEQ